MAEKKKEAKQREEEKKGYDDLVSRRSALWFRFSASYKPLALALGLTSRNARSECGGPKIESETSCYTAVNGEQTVGEHAVYTMDTKSQNYNALACNRIQMAIVIVTSHWSHQVNI